MRKIKPEHQTLQIHGRPSPDFAWPPVNFVAILSAVFEAGRDMTWRPGTKPESGEVVRLLAVVHALFPGGWWGAAAFIVVGLGLAFGVTALVAPPLPPDEPPPGWTRASYDIFDGKVIGGRVEMVALGGRTVDMVKGRVYRVRVLYRSSGPGGVHYVRTIGGRNGGGKYSTPGPIIWGHRAVQKPDVDGPAIVCLGGGQYAVVGALQSRRDGSLKMHVSEINRIERLKYFEGDLDDGLYGDDCPRLDEAAVERIGRVVGVRLPVGVSGA